MKIREVAVYLRGSIKPIASEASPATTHETATKRQRNRKGSRTAGKSERSAGIVIYMMLAVLVLVPLIITPGLLFYFDVTPKVAVLLIGTAVAIWTARRAGIRGPARTWGYALQWSVAAMALSLAVSTAVSIRPQLSFFGTNWRQFGLLTQISILLFAVVAAGRLSVERFLQATSCAGIPAALYGILQYFGWDPWIPAKAYHIGEEALTIVRPPGTLGYTSYFANYLLFVVFAGVGLSRSKQGAWRAVGLCAASLATAAIVLSGARAALLALIVGGALLLWWWRPRAGRWTVVAAAAALAGGLAFYWSPVGLQMRNRVRWFRDDPLGGARLWLWRDSLRMAAPHWSFGWGPETFSLEFPRHQSVNLARAYPDFYHESPHNMFLDTLTAQGVFGLGALLAWIGLGFYGAWRERGVLAAMLAASVVTHQFTVLIAPTALYLYVLVALISGGPLTSDDENRPAAGPRSSWPAGRPLAYARASVALILLLFAARLLAADRFLSLARWNLRAGHVPQSIEQIKRAGQLGMHADLWYSRSLARTDPGPAFDAGLRATNTAEDPQNAWYSLAALYAARNDYAATERSLRAASSCAPNWFKPHWLLAQLLLREGRIPEARAEAWLAVQLDAGKNQEVTQTWEQVKQIVPGK